MIDAFYSFSQFAQKLDFQITFVKIPRASQDVSVARGIGWFWDWKRESLMGKSNGWQNGSVFGDTTLMPKPTLCQGKLLLPHVM